MDEKSIFIRLLRLGEQKGIQGVSSLEFEAWASSQPEVEEEGDPEYFRLLNLRDECFNRNSEHRKDPVYVLKNEYYFRLVEFQELEESRKASTQANKNSTKAMIIAMAAILLSLIIGGLQYNTPTTINYDQVNRMETRRFPVSQKIESEQLSQVIEALKQSNINTAELAELIREQNKQADEKVKEK